MHAGEAPGEFVYLAGRHLVPPTTVYACKPLPFFISGPEMGMITERPLLLRTDSPEYALNGVSYRGPQRFAGFPLHAGRNEFCPQRAPCSIELLLQSQVPFAQYHAGLLTCREPAPAPAEHGDGDVVVRRVCRSAVCPITLQPMVYPCKGVRCRHPEGFDLLSWLRLARDQPGPHACPLCTQTMDPAEILLLAP